MKKLGVFVCHCGINIASTVNIPEVMEKLKGYTDVVSIKDNKYMCSDPGQKMIAETIGKEKLDGIIVGCCTPTLHEKTFRKVSVKSGLNEYMCEIANIREQCSWVTNDKKEATQKAGTILRSVIEKLKQNEPLDPIEIPIHRKALVVGGGIAGIQAAIDIADNGYEVILVEKKPSIGGKMAQLSETFPTLDCSQCILTPKMVEASQHPKIKLMTSCEVVDVGGFIGNFTVRIKRKATSVDPDKCTGCGLCSEKCPSKVIDEFNQGLGKRKAIYTPFPQAVPNIPVIDRDNCIYFRTGKCKICEKVCSVGAIDYEQKETFIDEEVGAIVMDTGYDLYDLKKLPEYGGGKLNDVIDGLTFERILSSSGPSNGKVIRPSDNTEPKTIVFIKCAGSRDPENHNAYCSKVCCMYSAKHAMLYKHRVPDGQAYIFYMDVRTGGKRYEEFYQRTQEDEGVIYSRGKVAKLYNEDGKVIVNGVDTLLGRNVEVKADLVVLATSIVPTAGTTEFANLIKTQTDEDGFLTEAHPKLRPVESMSAGIYLAGCGQGPKDIPETVSQASAAAVMVCKLFTNDHLLHEPIITGVDIDMCSGCGVCVEVCPYNAREMDESRGVVKVNEVLCEGCGACAVACVSGAARQNNYTDAQINEMIRAMLV